MSIYPFLGGGQMKFEIFPTYFIKRILYLGESVSHVVIWNWTLIVHVGR